MNGNKGTLGDPGDLGPRGFVGNKGNKVKFIFLLRRIYKINYLMCNSFVFIYILGFNWSTGMFIRNFEVLLKLFGVKMTLYIIQGINGRRGDEGLKVLNFY